MKQTLINIRDGFKNVLKGMGTNKDPRENLTYQRGKFINQQIANDLYVFNWLIAKIVDAPINDATKKWRTLLIPDAEKKQEIEEVYTKLQIKKKINQAMKWARVFGGAAIIIIIEGDDLETPLEVERIRPNSLKNLIVLDRHNITCTVRNQDILDENFGESEFYQVVRGGHIVHHTRVIKFTGVMSTIQQYEQQNYWGDSILTRLWEPVSDSQVVSNSINSLVYESNVDVYRVNEFHDLLAANDDELVKKKLNYTHQMKSIINGIVLDKEDEYEKKTNNFTNLPDIDDRSMQKSSGAADIPLTRLLGTSPSGMNATGESDMLNYHDNVSDIQENQIRPVLDRIDPIVIASEFPGMEPFKYTFVPLRQLNEMEQSDVDLKNAQRDQIYIDAGVISETDAMAELAENGTYVSIDETRVEEEKELEELEELELENEEEEENEGEEGVPGQIPEGSGNEIPEGTE